MKNGKNPTRRQKIAIKDAGLNPDDWLVFKAEATVLHIVHRNTGITKIIHI